MYRQVSSSPSSSVNVTPSSSPVFGPIDSSPPSSPDLVPYSLDSPPRPNVPFSHPFAASTKAIKRLPDYEKKTDSPPCTPPGTFARSGVGLDRVAPCSRSLQEDDYLNPGSGSPNASPPLHRTSRYIDREERIWDDALRKPFDTGVGQIDLSNQQLKSIPPSISDLSGFFNTSESSEQSLFVGRTLARINTEPAIDFRARSFERTQSIKDSGKDRHVLKLYLMGNMITSLPRELFSVKNLTVLSLRGNRLTFLPPDICRLTNLHELNISNNRLGFLPWQMQDMNIDKLLVHPNPFLPEPASDASRPHPLGPRRSMTRIHSLRQEALSHPTKPVLSPVTYALSRVPPLTELCLRLLLTPSDAIPSHTIIAEYYGLPLSDQWHIPSCIGHVLMDAVPGILRLRKRFSVDTVTHEDGVCASGFGFGSSSSGTGAGTCPNPVHKGRVFVRHASERFSWERRIAGVDVGGAVPVRWRGCLQTCLDFLDEEQHREEESKDRQGGVGTVVHVEEDVVDMGMAVQMVDLGSVSLDMDDFDD